MGADGNIGSHAKGQVSCSSQADEQNKKTGSYSLLPDRSGSSDRLPILQLPLSRFNIEIETLDGKLWPQTMVMATDQAWLLIALCCCPSLPLSLSVSISVSLADDDDDGRRLWGGNLVA